MKTRQTAQHTTHDEDGTRSNAHEGQGPLADQLQASPRMAAQRLSGGPVQRQVAGWAAAVCPTGTVVYHNTSQSSAISLATDGVMQVANQWGGGVLGGGFYTHTTSQGANNYGNGRYTVRFLVVVDLQGQVVPRGVIGHGIASHAYGPNDNFVTGNDFLTNEDDRNEYKFHGGNGLVFDGVTDNVTGVDYQSVQEFLDAVLT